MTPPKDANSLNVGIFDSGVGGLTVLREIRRLLPAAQLNYVADSGFAPYGDQTDDYIVTRSRIIVQALVDAGAQAVVVACNTATAAAVDVLRAEFALPIIAIEPAVKLAQKHTHSGRVGIVATHSTLDSARVKQLITDANAQGLHIFTQACTAWVACVEAGELDSAATLALLAQDLQPLLAQDIDTLVLGCTHFPLLSAQIQHIVGEGVQLIDPAPAVARELVRRLGVVTDGVGAGDTAFYTSGNVAVADRVLRVLSPCLGGLLIHHAQPFSELVE